MRFQLFSSEFAQRLFLFVLMDFICVRPASCVYSSALRSAGQLLVDKLTQYKRCRQCKRRTSNCGESNIWKDSHHLAGSQFMTWSLGRKLNTTQRAIGHFWLERACEVKLALGCCAVLCSLDLFPGLLSLQGLFIARNIIIINKKLKQTQLCSVSQRACT